MQAFQPPPWPFPTSPRQSPPKNPYLQQSLQHSMSMANLHDDPASHWPSSPPSPSLSTTSSVISRGPTPANNPWANATSPTSPVKSISNSRAGSPPICSSPTYSSPSNSRSSTPVAPQPIRPAFNTSMEIMQSMRPGPITPLRSPPPPYVMPAAPTPPMPTPRKELTGAGSLPATTDARVVEQMLGLVPGRWDPGTNRIIYDWVKQNPRIAFLFWWCDDIAAWPKAGIFSLPPLEDSMLPFQEADLERIARDPRKVIENQWRVMTKELIPNGQHTEFRSFETVPLQPVAVITSSELGSVERIRWYGQQDDRVYVRKSYIFHRSDQKDRILSKLQFFKRLDNSHIAKILCSYQQGNQIAFVTPPAICNLDEYLHHAAAQDPSRQELLLTWINDLVQALAYIHSSGKVYAHKDIRPRKILITSSFRIMFSVFGIAPSGTLGSQQTVESGVTTSATAGGGGSERYMYAAPEVIQRREQPSRPADVFALGCVLLNIMTVFRGQSLKTFLAYRMSQSAARDPSFHANREAVLAWMEKLKGVNSFVAGQWKSERERAVENKVFGFIGDMLAAEPGKRKEMKKLSSRVDSWNEGRVLARRRSLDGMERYATDMQGLERYYTAR